MGQFREASTQHDNLQLMIGEVKEVIEPDSDRSLSRLRKEYMVDVQYSDGSGPVTTVTFPNCTVSTLFGGKADHFRYGLRADANIPEGKKVSTTGSKVLLLCVLGNSTQAYILGGISDDELADLPGHNLDFSFNGISFNISDNGEAHFEFKGPTKVDGTLDSDRGASDSAGPLVMQILKDGSLEIYTKDKEQRLYLDNTNHKMVTEAKAMEYISSDGINISAGAGINIKAQKKVQIDAEAVYIGQASESMMLGTTYRAQEGQLNTRLSASFAALAAQATVAGTALNAAAQAMKAPIVGAIAAGTGPIQIAALAISAMTSLLTQLATSLQSFEAQAPRYLSHHKLD